MQNAKNERRKVLNVQNMDSFSRFLEKPLTLVNFYPKLPIQEQVA